MTSSNEILFIDRETKKLKVEKVYGQWFLNLIYKNFLGKFFRFLFTNKFFSYLYGLLQDIPLSKGKYENFIKTFDIKMEEFELDNPHEEVPYKTFNDFFIRKFKQGKRVFTDTPHSLPAFSEGRYFVYQEINDFLSFPIKGIYLRPKDILGEENPWGSQFEGASLIISRLCPVDYHRFHFPDQGKIIKRYRLKGLLESVNPIGLRYNQKLYLKNERQISLLETKYFGKMAFIEVGAICVGKIIQTKKVNLNFERGEEKGYFLFGGSSILVFIEKGKVIFDEDILENTKNHQETFIKLGSQIGILNKTL
tara:strand:+ start:542 stop:1465 length:924 start_codon:yes stop_codon:yes gene_type:complete